MLLRSIRYANGASFTDKHSCSLSFQGFYYTFSTSEFSNWGKIMDLTFVTKLHRVNKAKWHRDIDIYMLTHKMTSPVPDTGFPGQELRQPTFLAIFPGQVAL